jgi:hypothetical protein
MSHGDSKTEGALMHLVEGVRPRTIVRGSIPIVSKAGIVVIALGMFADLVAHLDAGLAGAGASMTGAQLSAHLVTFLGMVLVLAGVVTDGVRQNRQAHTPENQRRHHDAIR